MSAPMFIITGNSPKQQLLGEQKAHCQDCQRTANHSLYRHYSVRHLFWFPLFSMGTKYVQVCTRCNLHSEVPAPPPDSVSAAPLLHRRGFMFPLGVLLVPCLVLPALGAVLSIGKGGSAAASTDEVPPAGFAQRFSAQAEDDKVQSEIQALFEEVGMRAVTLKASSATVKGQVIRVITVRSTRLKKVDDGDRLRLLESMEAVADEHFAADEVFLGLQGRLLWGGYSHRASGEKWSRVVDGSTPNPETDALSALLRREMVAAPDPAQPAVPAPPPSAANE